MSIKKTKNGLRVQTYDTSVELRGHQDDDYYRVFTESLEAKTSISDDDIKEIKDELSKYSDIILD